MRVPLAAMWFAALSGVVNAGDLTPAERREREASAAMGSTIEGAAPEGGLARLIPHGLFRDAPSSCDNQRALQKIVHRFAWAERHTWRRGFVIAELKQPRLRYPSTTGP